MAGPFTIKFDDWSGGWAGDVDRGKAKKGQWFGQDVMVYTDGLLGPRPPLRKVTLNSPPAVDNQRVDEAIIYENLGSTRPAAAVIFAGDDFWYVVDYANFDTAVNIVETKAIGAGSNVRGVAIDSVNGRVYFSIDANTPLMRYHLPAGAVTTVATANPQPTGEAFCRWNERMVYGARDVLMWSEANDFITWAVANNASVGDGAPITTLVPAPLALYIAKTSGWWVITGVLGSTAIQRQVWEREGVEPAQIVGGASTSTKIGARTVAAWDRGMLWLRRRANDYRTDLTTGAVVPTVAVETSDLKSFSGAQMEQVATLRTSRQARLVGMSGYAAVVDSQNVPEATAVQHVVYIVNPDRTMSRHIFSSATITTADQVMCPLAPQEGANGPVAGYQPDHLWLAYARDSDAALQLRALRYRASRPGYGSDDATTQADDATGTHANVVGVVEIPDYWHPESRPMVVKEVIVVGRVYDNGYAGHYASTARVRATATVLGRTEVSGSNSNLDSSQLSWTESVAPGSGDRDMTIRFPVNDAGYGLGVRIRLELEMFALRAVFLVVDTGEVPR